MNKLRVFTVIFVIAVFASFFASYLTFFIPLMSIFAPNAHFMIKDYISIDRSVLSFKVSSRMVFV